LRILN